jgi:hypothetical protein
MASSCEQGNENSGSIQGEVYDYLAAGRFSEKSALCVVSCSSMGRFKVATPRWFTARPSGNFHNWLSNSANCCCVS